MDWSKFVGEVKLKPLWTAAWLVLGAAVLGLELLALTPATGTGTTLSEHVCVMLGLHSLVWIAGAGFTLWLVPHFLFRRR